MSTENIQEEIGKSASEKSSTRMTNSSSPGGTKKPTVLACDTGGKACTHNSKIPRPPLAGSNSFNETLKSIKSKGKIKKAPSMIPRSKSRKRNENDKVKFDITSKSEGLKNELNETSVSGDKKSKGILIGEESITVPEGNENSGKKYVRPCSSVKSCLNIVPNDSRKIVRQEIVSGGSDEEAGEEKERETWFDSVRNAEEQEKEKSDDEREAARQERTIRNLYETSKWAIGPPFDNFKRTASDHVRGLDAERLHSDPDTEADVPSIQGQYELTLKEISSVWKNTISLVGSVRDHVVKFVEENNKLIDKEQLVLEAEMLQLALDFAISYSKLKSDFLIKFARKRLNVRSLEKTELENFMDSKTFAALYNNDDLAAMARTVQDLNTSLLKGEDLELE